MAGEAITHEGRDFAPDGAAARPAMCDCGHAPTPDGISAGYARDASGRTRCLACADRVEVEAFERDETRTWIGYLETGGAGPTFRGDLIASASGLRTAAAEPAALRLTTWQGTVLATVTSIRAEKRSAPSGGRYTRVYFRATDAKGRHWYGTTPGLGMYARMRRAAE
jgi:hypothetical protein